MTGATVAAGRLPSIGWVGTGVMGSAMCGHLVAAGHPVKVFSRTRERAGPLVAAGARWSGSPAEVAASADIVVTMVGYPADVREVVLGLPGALSAALPGSTLIDMTTSRPPSGRGEYLPPQPPKASAHWMLRCPGATSGPGTRRS